MRCNGVADGTRTHDNRNHNPGLYQLSYNHHATDYNLKLEIIKFWASINSQRPKYILLVNRTQRFCGDFELLFKVVVIGQTFSLGQPLSKLRLFTTSIG